MSRLSAVSLSRRCQQQGRFTEKARPERVERPDPARAVVRSLGGCGRKERGNQPLPFVILPVHVPWKGEKGPAPELASPPCSSPLCPDWGSLLPAPPWPVLTKFMFTEQFYAPNTRLIALHVPSKPSTCKILCLTPISVGEDGA